MSLAANFLVTASAMAMQFPGRLNSIAAMASERLLFSLGIGTLLAAVVWLLLRVFPQRDSRTSFAVWFATLLITAALPVLSLYQGPSGHGQGAPEAVITVSSSWAVYAFLGWASAAWLGLARVAIALWQIRRLRSGAVKLETRGLDPELRALVERSRKFRPVELLVSGRLEVPTATGFFRPAVVLPEWLLEDTPAEELKYVLLHELEHLRRRDDWTNLAQQIVKSLLFFVPSVWWIERRLALDREMACDDAVLAQSGTPRGYAECLAKVAERSFLRRQLALAQAAVSKLRQLTVRVARILDPNRRQPAPIWKPAVPAVIVVAGLCAFTASQSPTFIGFADDAPVQGQARQSAERGSLAKTFPAGMAAAAAQMPGAKQTQVAAKTAGATQARLVAADFKDSASANDSASAQPRKVRAWEAALKSSDAPPGAAKIKRAKRKRNGVPNLRAGVFSADPVGAGVSKLGSTEAPALLAKAQPQQAEPEYVTVREEFVIVVSRQSGDAATESWQMRMIEISVVQPKPRKSVPRKI